MALNQIPNPYPCSWRDWCDTVVGYNPTIRPTVSPDLPWREVAERLAEFEQLAPRPVMFNDWREWAAALKQAYPD